MKGKSDISNQNPETRGEIQISSCNSNSKEVNGQKVYQVDINLVEPDSSVMKVYMQKDLRGLKLTMNFVGLLQPVKARIRDGKYKIFDGISRYLSARELGWKTLLIEVYDYSDDEIEDKFVLHNFKTRRSYKELCRQAEVILGILGLSQGKRREKIGDLSFGDENFGLTGKDRFEIACEIIQPGISPTTLRRLLEVKEFDETGTCEEKDFKLMDKLESGEMKIHQAHNFTRNYKSCKKEEGRNALTEAVNAKSKNYKLYNKSCEDLSDLADESVNTAITSPPYFQQRDYPDGVRDTAQPQHGMERTVDEYVKKEVEIYRGVYRKLKKTGSLFIVITDSYDGGVNCLVIEKLIVKMDEAGWFLNQKILWYKKNPKPQSVYSKRLQPTYEYVLHFVKDPKAFYYKEFKIWKKDGKYGIGRGSKDTGFGHKGKSHTWTLKKPLKRFKNFLFEQDVEKVFLANGFVWEELKEIDPSFRHLAPYPSVIPLLPILMSTRIGDTVLDIFNGTSTTTAVALQLGRKAIGYDTDTMSYKFAEKRLKMVEDNLPSHEDVIDFEKEFMDVSESKKCKDYDDEHEKRA